MIKDEFEKAFEWPEGPYKNIYKELRLEGSKWMAEKCAKEVCGHDDNFPKYKDCCDNRDRIRQLFKELQRTTKNYKEPL